MSAAAKTLCDALAELFARPFATRARLEVVGVTGESRRVPPMLRWPLPLVRVTGPCIGQAAEHQLIMPPTLTAVLTAAT